MAKPKRYRNIAPLIRVKTMTMDGMRVIDLYQGAPLPEDTDQASIDHHLRLGMIEEVADLSEPLPPLDTHPGVRTDAPAETPSTPFVTLGAHSADKPGKHAETKPDKPAKQDAGHSDEATVTPAPEVREQETGKPAAKNDPAVKTGDAPKTGRPPARG